MSRSGGRETWWPREGVSMKTEEDWKKRAEELLPDGSLNSQGISELIDAAVKDAEEALRFKRESESQDLMQKGQSRGPTATEVEMARDEEQRREKVEAWRAMKAETERYVVEIPGPYVLAKNEAAIRADEREYVFSLLGEWGYDGALERLRMHFGQGPRSPHNVPIANANAINIASRALERKP